LRKFKSTFDDNPLVHICIYIDIEYITRSLSRLSNRRDSLREYILLYILRRQIPANVISFP